jgi:hypothetical protein
MVWVGLPVVMGATLVGGAPSLGAQAPDLAGRWTGQHQDTTFDLVVSVVDGELCGMLSPPGKGRELDPSISTGAPSKCPAAATGRGFPHPDLMFWGFRFEPTKRVWTIDGTPVGLGRIRQVWEREYGSAKEDIGGNEHRWSIKEHDNGKRLRVRVDHPWLTIAMFDLTRQ